jgi:hypothetical protein
MLSSWRQMSNVATPNEQVAVFPDASIAVHVTLVVPTGKIDPEAGEQLAITPWQLSDAVGGG